MPENETTEIPAEPIQPETTDDREAAVGDETFPEETEEYGYDDLEEEDQTGEDLPEDGPEGPYVETPPAEREPTANAAQQFESRVSGIENSVGQLINTFNQFVQHQAAQTQQAPPVNQGPVAPTPPVDLEAMDQTQLVNHALQEADRRVGTYLTQMQQATSRQMQTQGNLFANVLRSLFAERPEFQKDFNYINRAAEMWMRNQNTPFEDYVALAKTRDLQNNNQQLQRQAKKGQKANQKRAAKARRGSKSRRNRAPVGVKPQLTRQQAIEAAQREVDAMPDFR
jgi:hypothetical protein